MKKTRFLALIVSCAMLMMLLAGCGGASYGTIGEKDIDAELFNAAASNTMYMYISNGYDADSLRDMLAQEDESGTTAAEEIKQYCLDSVTQFYAIEAMAEEHNIKLTDDEKAAIEEDKQSYIDQMGGRSEFVKSLTDSGMTEEVYDRLQELSALQQKLSSALFNKGGVHEVSEEEIVADMTENCVRVVHILIQAQENSTDFAEKKALAQATLKRARAGEDFNALIAEVGEDPGMQSSPNGYVFDKNGYSIDNSGGQMVTEFVEGSWAIGVGEISDLVQTSYGFHIIKRLPIDAAYVSANMDAHYPYYAGMAFSFELAGIVAELEVNTNDEFKALDMASFIPTQQN